MLTIEVSLLVGLYFSSWRGSEALVTKVPMSRRETGMGRLGMVNILCFWFIDVLLCECLEFLLAFRLFWRT